MTDFPTDNTYPSSNAKHVMIAVFISGLLFLLARLVSGVLMDWHHHSSRDTVSSEGISASHVGPTAGTGATNIYHHRLLRGHRATDALRDVFVTLGIVCLAWERVNGVGRGFEILVWISLAVGVLWALARATHTIFADLLLLVFIPLFIALFALTL